MPDVETTCVQCKEVFLFTEKEQETFYQRNMMAPKRCAKCRSKKAVTGDEASP
ncbi:MAG: zinc-ribbon domain-containing protein [Acidobacteria bacterium]|nr:zinc-ribbon domain-containing protein [Acidobacteriota bacterium]